MILNKITIFTAEFPPQPGGIGNHAYNLAKGLKREGYHIKVLCDTRSEDGEEEKLFDASLDFEVIRIKRKKIILISYLQRIIKAYKLAGTNEIFIASGKFPLWIGGLLLSLFLKNKYIAVVHGSELLLPNKLLRKLTDISLQKFDNVIAVSNYTKSLITSPELKNVKVIHNGFSVHCACGNQKEKPFPILVTVGNVTRRKGQHNVVSSLPLLLKKYPELQYRIIGIPTEEEKLQQLAKELHVENGIKFYGRVEESEKCELLLTSGIFMMLSEATDAGDVEGFGIAILEANSLGIPAIGAKGCGIEEAIKDGYSGLLVNNKEPGEIQTSVDRILRNYDEFSDNARNWSANFTWDKVIPRYVEILESK